MRGMGEQRDKLKFAAKTWPKLAKFGRNAKFLGWSFGRTAKESFCLGHLAQDLSLLDPKGKLAVKLSMVAELRFSVTFVSFFCFCFACTACSIVR